MFIQNHKLFNGNFNITEILYLNKIPSGVRKVSGKETGGFVHQVASLSTGNLKLRSPLRTFLG